MAAPGHRQPVGGNLGAMGERPRRAYHLAGVDLYANLWEQIRTMRNLNGHPYEFYQKLGYAIIGVMPDASGRGKPDIFMGKRMA